MRLIVKRFGGSREIWRALRDIGVWVTPMTVYRWSYTRFLPPERVSQVVEAGAKRGLFFTPDELLAAVSGK